MNLYLKKICFCDLCGKFFSENMLQFLVFLFSLGALAPLFGSEPPGIPHLGAHSQRLELEGIGTLLACPPSDETEGKSSQLLLEKPGGMVEVIYTLEGMSFISLLRGDLDGDQVPEIVAVARSSTGPDLVPYIFSEKQGFTCLYPGEDEDTPLIGEEILLVAGKDVTSLCVRNKLDFHQYGPPLIQSEFYRLSGKRIQKTGESFAEGSHFNLQLNRAALFFQRGQYLEAQKGYQSVLEKYGAVLPREATAEALFYQAESRKFLKDFKTAETLYQKVVSGFPDSKITDAARKEPAFLSGNSSGSAELSLYIDAGRLNDLGQSEKSLELLNRYLLTNATGPLADRLFFLKGEALSSLDRTDEAISVFRDFKRKFSNSPLIEDVNMHLEELIGNPEESENEPTHTGEKE